MREEYTKVEMEIVRFESEDIIVSSDEWELPED